MKLSLGRITAIVNWSQFCIQVHTDTGSASFSHTAKEFKREAVSTVSSTYSYDNDGTMFKNAGMGRFNVTRYHCVSPCTVIATVGIEFADYDTIVTIATAELHTRGTRRVHPVSAVYQGVQP